MKFEKAILQAVAAVFQILQPVAGVFGYRYQNCFAILDFQKALLFDIFRFIKILFVVISV